MRAKPDTVCVQNFKMDVKSAKVLIYEDRGDPVRLSTDSRNKRSPVSAAVPVLRPQGVPVSAGILYAREVILL